MSLDEAHRQCRALAAAARAAAQRKDWAQNHRLCRTHDELALRIMRREL